MKKFIWCIFFIFVLSGCGGGGDSSSGSGTSSTDVSGTWSGTTAIDDLSCGGDMTAVFSQSGINLSGNLTANISGADCDSGQSSNTFTGEISGDSISLTDNDGDTYSLTLNSSNNMSGTINSQSSGLTASLNLSR